MKSVFTHDPAGDYPIVNVLLLAHSATWLVLAGAILALGIYRELAVLRYASLAVQIVAVVKALVFDMADLTGLHHVASFLGRGLALVGIGCVNQRFMFAAGKITPPGVKPGGVSG